MSSRGDPGKTAQLKFETRTVHAGFEPDAGSGAVVPPIQMSTTFKQD
jgi:cystathionine gamma-synthase